MDFVNRLKTFMNSESITSTQFADACRIPRPTLSQILSGRNKKISDEVIGKIHEAYPSLSVLWLLFGEGAMLVGQNIKSSEPQNSGYIDFSGSQMAENLKNTSGETLMSGGDVFGSDKSGGASLFDIDDKRESGVPRISIEEDEDAETQIAPRQVSISADGSKSIVNIMVFYSDNSFQSFVPSGSIRK